MNTLLCSLMQSVILDSPVAVATQHTVDFVRPHVLSGQVLEVGCGSGELAVAMSQLGYQVTALDQNKEAVELAVSRGVNAHHSDWLSFDGTAADAVLFTRSLHHMHELDASLAKARKLLRVGGSLIVEDFDFEALDQHSINWLYEKMRSTHFWPLLQKSDDELIACLVSRSDPESIKTIYRGHHLHGARVMSDAVFKEFGCVDVNDAPYLYRYLIRVLPKTREAARFVQSLRSAEEEAGQSGEINLIGLRLAAQASS